MNQNLFNSVYKELKNHLEKNSNYNPTVKTIPTGETYPLVVVEEVENSISSRTSCGIQTTSLIGIEINIYTKAKPIGTIKYANRTIAIELSNLVDEVLDKMYGMRRVTSKPTPNVDTTIYRKTMIYNRIQNDNRSRF